MALNKDGYSTEIEVTLPKAQRQKTAEAEAGGRAALFQKIQEKNAARSESLPATSHCDRCGRLHHLDQTSTQGQVAVAEATLDPNRGGSLEADQSSV